MTTMKYRKRFIPPLPLSQPDIHQANLDKRCRRGRHLTVCRSLSNNQRQFSNEGLKRLLPRRIFQSASAFYIAPVGHIFRRRHSRHRGDSQIGASIRQLLPPGLRLCLAVLVFRLHAAFSPLPCFHEFRWSKFVRCAIPIFRRVTLPICHSDVVPHMSCNQIL